MFEQAFKNIDDVLWKDAGCTSELDYTEQTSWLLFLKYLDALESDLATAAALNGKPYSHILDQPYRWESWAAPKGSEGKIDHNKEKKSLAYVIAIMNMILHGIEAPIIPPRGDYQTLLSYQKAEVIYDITFRFAHKYLGKGDRTVDQMIQSARSGKQNILEGSKAALTSKETEIKLTSVGRASLEELLADSRDYRNRNNARNTSEGTHNPSPKAQPHPSSQSHGSHNPPPKKPGGQR